MGIAVVVTSIIALIVGFLTGILVYYCISNHQSQSTKPQSSLQNQPQTVSSSNPLDQTGPEYAEVPAKKIEIRENVAYVHVKQRELRTNIPDLLFRIKSHMNTLKFAVFQKELTGILELNI